MTFHILIIEDNPGDALMLQMMLQSAVGREFTIERADRLSSGFEMLQSGSFDAVLLDLGLPDSQGIETVRAVHGRFPRIPIIVLTGREDDELAAQAVREGAQDYLEKTNLPSGTLCRTVWHAIERSSISERLRDTENLFRLITENAADMIVVADHRGNRFYTSPSYQRILGYSGEELLRTSAYEQIHPDDHELVRATLEKARADGTGGTIIYRMRHKDGTWRHIESITATVRDQPGDIIRMVGINRDVTERKQLEEQFMQSQKMEAVGRLSGGIAHDFNNLLAVIIGYCEFLREGLPSDHALRASADEIMKAGTRAAALTRQLLAFSRQQVLNPKVLDLNAIVNETGKLLRRVIGEDIVLETNLDANLGRVKTDQTQIEQILMNLAVNARDAMPDGGTLTVETQNAERDGTSAQNRYRVQPGPYVRLKVTDNGIGMDAATSDRVFEPFFTTKEKGKGTGLGLSTVYGIVKQSGGYIEIDSVPGAGTTFTIYLPRTDEKPTFESAESGNFRTGHETILIVEDEPSLRTLSRNTLQACGYTVLEAKDGEEALTISRAHHGGIDVLLTDVVMPGMGGKALAQKVSSERPATKVVYMSGYPGGKFGDNWPAEAGVLLLTKPFTRRDLCQKIGEALENRVASPVT